MRYGLIYFAAMLGMCQAAEEENFEYTQFAAAMAFWGYTWEPIKLKTDDGWTLTTFHITGKRGEEEVERGEDLNPVIVNHGQSMDSVSLVLGKPLQREHLPLPMQLYDRGFDVYLPNNRGTQYSQVHDTLTVDDPEFWKFSWAEMGMYDAVSNVRMVKERTGKKVSWVGVSQGTV